MSTPTSTDTDVVQSDGDAAISSKKEGQPQAASLRIWPAIALVILMWALRIGLKMVPEPGFAVLMTQFIGPAIVSGFILIWWFAGSRARVKEKVIGGIGLLLILAITTALADKTVMGLGTIIFAIPMGTTAFAVAAILAGTLYPLRTAIVLLAAGTGYGYWDLVRIDEFRGDFSTVKHWRWEPTAEELFMQSSDAEAPKPIEESEADQQAAVDALANPEWAGFRGGDRQGVQPNVALVEDWENHRPKEVWRRRVGPAWSSFAVAGNRLFTQEQRGDYEAVTCYDLRDGSPLWVRQDETRFWETIGGAGPRGTPTIADSALYTLGANGLLSRLEPATGSVRWQADLRKDSGREPPTWGFSSSPLVADGLVLVHAGGDGDKGLFAYDAESGELRWSAPSGDHSYSSPQLATIDGKQCVLMLTNRGMRFFELESGAVIGRHEWEFPGYRVVQPLIVDETGILLGRPMSDGTRYLDAKWGGEQFTLEERWTSIDMKPYYNDYVLHKGFLYGFDNNIFACVDLDDGKRKWKKGRYGNGQVLLLPKKDQLLVISEDGELVLLRATPEKSEELARHRVFDARTWNHPVVVGNRLFVRNGEEAVCLELEVE